MKGIQSLPSKGPDRDLPPTRNGSSSKATVIIIGTELVSSNSNVTGPRTNGTQNGTNVQKSICALERTNSTAPF